MSQDMNRFPGNSYHYLANSPSRSKLTTLKGYLSSGGGYSTPSPPGSRAGSSQNLTENPRQGWRSWAGEKARKLGEHGGWRTTGGNESSSDNIEKVTLFPGWAARRYRKQIAGDEKSPRPFEVEVFTSGYAISYKNRDNVSRSQRAFIRVAKGFAALPKLTSQPSLLVSEPPSLSKSTEDLLSQVHLPPRPEEITDGYDMDALERQFRHAKSSRSSTATGTPSDRADSDSSSISSALSSTNDLASALKGAGERMGPPPEVSSSTTNPLVAATEITAETLRRMHANLEARLQPFWSTVLPNRTVRLHLFASPHHDPSSSQLNNTQNDDQNKPLASIDVTTVTDGSFQAKFIVKWDELCHHPTTLQIAFGEEIEEHTLVVVAELLPPQPSYAMSGDAPGYAQYQSPRRRQNQEASRSPTTKSQVQIPITNCPIRVISDIDDTVKDSGILNGARAVFHNVFVKDLGDCVVSGMGEWYTDMWRKGIRFHYVSNGPFEYLSVLDEFFPLSQLPPGSIKLRSFAGRSLFNGFFSAPAARKRAGVEDILKAFPESQFFLIGDSGEQDLELYAELSQKYANNVLAVFIRDVTTKLGVTDPLDDPTGWNAVAVQTLDQSNDANPGERDEPSRSPSPSGGHHYRSLNSARSRRSVTEVLVGVGKRSSNSLSSFLSYKEKDNATTGGDGFFTSANSPPLSASPPRSSSPEREVDDGPTPRLGSNPVMEHSPTVKASPKKEGVHRPTIHRKSAGSGDSIGALIQSAHRTTLITEAPRPISPPTLHHAPTGTSIITGSSMAQRRMRQQQRQQTGDSSASDDGNASKISMASGLTLPTSGVSLDDRRRNELQMRIWRARTVMPGHVKLRVFREPSECVEAGEVLPPSEIRS